MRIKNYLKKINTKIFSYKTYENLESKIKNRIDKITLKLKQTKVGIINAKERAKDINLKIYFQKAQNFLEEKAKDINLKIYFQKAQNFLEEKIRSNNEEVVLNQARLWAQSITWTLISGTTFALGWLAIAETEEIIIATGKLEPKGGVVEVQMPLQGITEKILVKEGEKVKQGQVLIELDTEITRARQASLMRNLKIGNEILFRLKFLSEQGAVAEVQVMEQENKIEGIKRELIENEITLKYQEIVSPIDGFIFDLQPKSKGFVARTSVPILKIVPLNKLQAEVEINSNDIGFVNTGKTADISIDSFPSTDFGVVKGEVIRIGSNALPPDPSLNKGYRFPANIKLETQNLILKNGQSLPLQAGMSITANIKLRKVSYLQLLLNNFQTKADSLKQL